MQSELTPIDISYHPELTGLKAYATLPPATIGGETAAVAQGVVEVVARNLGDEMANDSYTYQQLSTTQLHVDRNHPRKVVADTSEEARLKRSIAAYGMLQPIIVTPAESGLYTIIDDQRRYKVAQDLNLATVPTIIYSRMKPADLEIKHFDLQNNYLPCKPLERSHAR